MSGDPGWVKQEAGPPNGAAGHGIEAVGRDADPLNGLDTTDGTLLGGRISYRQYRGAYRTGLEPVLMAAAVPALPGQRVLEAGCGAAAGLLCLAARVAGLSGVGIEQDAGMAALAEFNLGRNGLHWPIQHTALQRADGTDRGSFHHAFANPPWHRPASTRSADARRDLARHAPDGTLAAWTAALASRLRTKGTLTLALPAASHAEAAAAMLAAGLGSISVLPLWPKPGRAARIILVQGIRGSRGDGAILPGLTLHRLDGGLTEEAEAILRAGAALPIGRQRD